MNFMHRGSGVYYHPQQCRVVPPIRQITPKNLKEIKLIDKAKQGVYTGVLKGAEFKKLNLANSNGLNLRKLTPLHRTKVKSESNTLVLHFIQRYQRIRRD